MIKSSKLLPSVSFLVHKHLLLDVIPQIEPTGPKGRLTKGDVLQYINSGPSSVIDERFESLNLNTQNITLLIDAAISATSMLKLTNISPVRFGIEVLTSIVNLLDQKSYDSTSLSNGESAILEISKPDNINDHYLDSFIDSKNENGVEKFLKRNDDDIYDYLATGVQVGGSVRLDLTFNSKRIDQKDAKRYLEQVKNLIVN